MLEEESQNKKNNKKEKTFSKMKQKKFNNKYSPYTIPSKKVV